MHRLKCSENLKGPKSFSESLRKHIFHRGIISRTPKRDGITSPNVFEVIIIYI